MAEHIRKFARLSLNNILRLFPSRRFGIFALITFAALVTSGLLVFAFPSFAQQQGEPVSIAWQWLVEGLVWLMLQLATLFIQLTVFLLRFFILIAGYNDYINAPVVILGWNMVRDVANMFFIVILMVIAFGTILGLEQYEWRKSLVKLILAAILVNFSNLIVQLLIDVAQVFTVTFLNAVAGAAGGNLIQMFNFDKIFDIAVGSPEEMTGDLLLNLFGAGVIAVIFAGMAMFTMGAYLVVLLARMVVLWVAIILSPLMFMFSVLPQTKKYADEYWSEVTNHILAAPVMVFFMWLAFATFGGGNGAVAHIEDNHALKDQGKLTTKETNAGAKPSATFNKAAGWENMANFAVALAFLWLGIDRVQKLGVKGGGLTQSAIGFGKNVATIASGYAAGRWLVGKGSDFGGAAIKTAAYNAPLGGRFWKSTGTYVKGRVGYKWQLRQEKKNERYAEWEKNQLKAGNTKRVAFKRALGAVTGGVVGQSAARFEKISEDWKDTAERQKEITAESYSTGSSTEAGKTKTRVTARKKMMEQMLAEKKARKVEQEEAAIVERVAAGTATEEEKSAVKKLTTAGEERYKRRELRHEKQILDAEREAGILFREGKELEAQAIMKAAHASQLKEKSEVLASMDHSSRVNTAANITTQTQQLQRDLAMAVDAETKKGIEKKLATLREQMTLLLTVAAQDSEEQYNDVLGEALDNIHGAGNYELNKELEGQRLLEVINGSKINTIADFNTAHKNLEGSNTFKNTGQSQAALAALAGALKKQGLEGGQRSVGAVIEDTKTNAEALGTEVAPHAPVALRFAANKHLAGASNTDPRIVMDAEKKKSTERWFQRNINLKQARNLHGFMKMKGKTVVGIDDEAAKQLVAALDGFGDKREVAGGFSSKISAGNSVTEHFTDQTGRQEFVNKVLRPLKAKYASSPEMEQIFNKIMETQFGDFIGPPNVPDKIDLF